MLLRHAAAFHLLPPLFSIILMISLRCFIIADDAPLRCQPCRHARHFTMLADDG